MLIYYGSGLFTLRAVALFGDNAMRDRFLHVCAEELGV